MAHGESEVKQYIGSIALVVADYDEAIAWYTTVLGFRLVEDTDMGAGKRWVVVAPPGATETRLLLAKASGAEQAARVLGQKLQYVRGRPGNEIYLALRNIGGSGLIPYRHRLFLQFRHGRLAGWKEDYGENWMWE